MDYGLSSVLKIILGLSLVFALIYLYFLPAVIASKKDHKNETAIAFLNFVAGWTMIGWVACFIWACVGERKSFDSNWSPGPVSSTAASIQEAQKPKRRKLNKFLLILNFILAGLLISYLIRPDWLDSHRSGIIKTYKKIFSGKNALTTMPKGRTITEILENFSDKQLIFDQQTNVSEKQLYRKEIVRRHPQWPETLKESVLKGSVTIGMTKDQVLASWGRPIQIKKKKTFWEMKEQWFYGAGSDYLYFLNERLTDIKKEEMMEFQKISAIQE